MLTFKLKAGTNWAPAGHQVAFGELPIQKPLSISKIRSLEPPTPKPQAKQTSRSNLQIVSATSQSTWIFDLTTGDLVSWNRANFPGHSVVTEPITMDFYRALTDNDRGAHGKDWVNRRVHQTKAHVRQVQWKEVEDGLQVQVTKRIAPPVLCWAVDAVFTYAFRGDSVTVRVQGKPHGLLLPETFARIGITLGLSDVSKAKWWGRGPGESYRDRKLSQRFGNWEASIDDLWVDYEFPQDGGNRTDVRWVDFVGEGGSLLTAEFGDLDGASFSAMHYATKDIDECTHPYELHKRKLKHTIVRLDWAHHGLGTGSCGPPTLPKYQLKTDKEFDVEIRLS